MFKLKCISLNISKPLLFLKIRDVWANLVRGCHELVVEWGSCKFTGVVGVVLVWASSHNSRAISCNHGGEGREIVEFTLFSCLLKSQ